MISPEPQRRPVNGKTRATLLDRLRDGRDALAWDELFERYRPLIYSFARHRGCSGRSAEEVVQDVSFCGKEHWPCKAQ
jgi:hypothetical protein